MKEKTEQDENENRRRCRKRKERPLTSYFSAPLHRADNKITKTITGTGIRVTIVGAEQQYNAANSESLLGLDDNKNIRSSVPIGSAADDCSVTDAVITPSSSSSLSVQQQNVLQEDSTTNDNKETEMGRDIKDLKKKKKNKKSSSRSAATTPSPSKNIVHRLHSLSIHGPSNCCGRRQPSIPCQSPSSLLPLDFGALSWEVQSKLNFEPGNGGATTANNNSNGTNTMSTNAMLTIKRLAWDAMGVLLAVCVDNGFGNLSVRLYDWDTVRTAAMHIENNSNNSNISNDDINMEEEYAVNEPTTRTIEPVLSFPIPGRSITFLQWNPFHHDELIVGSPTSGCVYLFDVAEVNAWHQQQRQQQQQGSSRRRRRVPFRTFSVGQSGDAVSCSVFVDGGDCLIFSCKNELTCWHRASNAPTATGQCKWKFRWNNMITAMSTVSSTTLLVGSSKGYFCLLDWKHVVRGSFSRQPSPTILQEWLSYRGLEEETPASSWMGIRHIHVAQKQTTTTKLSTGTATTTGGYGDSLLLAPFHNKNYNSKDQKQKEQQKHGSWWGHCHITWVTACGWVLSTILESATKKPSDRRRHTTVLHATAPIRCINSEGEEVIPARPSWSLPATCGTGTAGGVGGGVLADSVEAGATLCWEKVASVTRILPHQDKYVLDSQPRLIRSEQAPTVLWKALTENFGPGCSNSSCSLSGATPSTATISLPASKGPPTAFAVHPEREWIVVGTSSHGLYAVRQTRKRTVDSDNNDNNREPIIPDNIC